MSEELKRSKIIEACYLVPGQTWPTELGWLYDTFCHSTAHVEIGTFCGRSLLASCGGMGHSKVVSVDNLFCWPNPEWVEAVLNTTEKLLPPTVHLTKLRCNSIDAARQCLNMGLRFDSVFIDACHEYAECCADIEAWMPLVRPGGLISGHDYWPAHVGVMQAVNECLNGRFKLFEGTRIWFSRVE